HRRGSHGKPFEALRGRQGQRYPLSRAWWGDGSDGQRDGRRTGAVFRARTAGSGSMIGVVVLGSTGSVGANTLDVIARNPDRFRLVAIGANRNAAILAQQIRQFRPAYAALADASAARELTQLLGDSAR